MTATQPVTDRALLSARIAHLATGKLVVRTARKTWRCVSSSGAEAQPSCPGTEIRPGELYVEYLGDAPAYGSGSRYHPGCAIATWSAIPSKGVEKDRAWRRRTTAERSRPTRWTELLGDLLRVSDEARGSTKEVVHVVTMYTMLVTVPLVVCLGGILYTIYLIAINLVNGFGGEIRVWGSAAAAGILTWTVAGIRNWLIRRRRR
jgi:hypothetical protein